MFFWSLVDAVHTADLLSQIIDQKQKLMILGLISKFFHLLTRVFLSPDADNKAVTTKSPLDC